MKKNLWVLAPLLISAMIVNIKCSNNSSTLMNTPDTVKQLMAYIDKDSNRVSQIGARITKDTGLVVKGSNTVVWKRDSLYFAQGLFPLYDSAGVARKDTSGRPMMQWLWYPLKKSDVVRDGDFTRFNLDSFWAQSPKKK